MKSWRDVPILILGFNRPYELGNLLSHEDLSKFNAVTVAIDGPRQLNNEDEIAQDLISRNLENFDFSVTKNESNLGSFAITNAISNIMENNDYLIVIEDDIYPAIGALRIMAEKLLSLDDKNATLGAYSPNLFFNKALRTNSWRESYYFCPWLWGVNKKVWMNYKQELNSDDLAKLVHSETWNSLSADKQARWFLRFLWVVNNPGLTWDFQMQYLHFSKSLRSIRPWKSLALNQGFNSDGQRTFSEPIWNPKSTGSTIFKESKMDHFKLSNFIDSLTFAADNGFLDGKLHTFMRNIYK